MSLDGLSLDTSTHQKDHNLDREEDVVGDDPPMEGFYRKLLEEVHREAHAAIHQSRQSRQGVSMDQNLSDYRLPLIFPSPRQSHLMPITTASSYPTYSSPEQSAFISPLVETTVTKEDSIETSKISDTLRRPRNLLEESEVGQHNSSVTSMNRSANRRTNSSRASRRFHDGAHQSDRSNGSGSFDSESTPRDHPLYLKAIAGPDGLYHCPWEGNDPACNHRPEKLKCNYDKFVDSHLKPYRCRIHNYENARFSSTACLLRHEREAHMMHGHGERPFLCTAEGCERSVPGNGFPRHWNLCDHMKRVHNRSPSPSNARSPQSRLSSARKRVQNSPPPSELGGDILSQRRIQIARRLPGLDETLQASRNGFGYEYGPKLSPAQKEFRDKIEELISIIKRVQGTDDNDALKNLRAAEECLKYLTREVMKRKAGPGGVISKGDLDMPH